MTILTDVTQAVLNEPVQSHRCKEIAVGSACINTATKCKRHMSSVTSAATSEVVVKKCCPRKANMKIKRLDNKILRLTTESNKVADRIKTLGRENGDKKKILLGLQKAHETRVVVKQQCEELERIIENEKLKIKVKETEIEKQWEDIKKLDDVNVKLSHDAKEFEKREKRFKDEIAKIKLALQKDNGAFGLQISSHTSDWNRKLKRERFMFSKSWRRAVDIKRNNQRVGPEDSAKNLFFEKLLRKSDTHMKVKGHTQLKGHCRFFQAAECLKFEEKTCTTTEQIEQQDSTFLIVDRSLGSCEKSPKINIWKTFEKWNWKLDFPAKTYTESQVKKSEVSPACVPLKIIEDRVVHFETNNLEGDDFKNSFVVPQRLL